MIAEKVDFASMPEPVVRDYLTEHARIKGVFTPKEEWSEKRRRWEKERFERGVRTRVWRLARAIRLRRIDVKWRCLINNEFSLRKSSQWCWDESYDKIRDAMVFVMNEALSQREIEDLLQTDFFAILNGDRRNWFARTHAADIALVRKFLAKFDN